MSDLESAPYDRSSAVKAYQQMYGRHWHTGSCFYCGAPDDVDDHVPPLAVVHRLRGFIQGQSLLLVRSCAACNASLGDMPLMTPEDRRAFIRAEVLPGRADKLRLQIAQAQQTLDRLRSQLSELEAISRRSQAVSTLQQFKDLAIGTRFTRVTDARVHQKTSIDGFMIEKIMVSADIGEWVLPLWD